MLQQYGTSLQSISLSWFGLASAVSFLAGWIWFTRQTKQMGIAEGVAGNIVALSVLGGILGAWLTHVAAYWWYYSMYPTELLAYDISRWSLHGAVGGAALVVAPYVRRRGISFGGIADLAVPGLAIGVVLTRLVSYMVGTQHGRATAHAGFAFHPVDLYGSVVGIAVLLAWAWARRQPAKGEGYPFWIAVLLYSLLRSVLEEPFRQVPLYLMAYRNGSLGIGLITLGQLAGLVCIILAVWFLRQLRKRDSTSALKTE